MKDPSNVREQIAHYERTAAKFDSSVWSLGNRDNRNHLVKVAAISRAIGASSGGLVLEVGTGTGLHGRWLLSNTPIRYVGVDASQAMLTLAATLFHVELAGKRIDSRLRELRELLT